MCRSRRKGNKALEALILKAEVKLMSRIKWYYERLKAMDPVEIAWRVAEKSKDITTYRRLAKKRLKITDRNLFGEKSMAARAGDFMADRFYIDLIGSRAEYASSALSFDFEYADRLCEGTVSIFGNEHALGKDIDWHTAFKGEKSWPVEFSPSLDFRQRDDIGDARLSWELNRHYHFATLACAYYLSGDEKYIDALSRQFYSWTDSNPFMLGISWTSTMESAIRALSWLWAYAFLRASCGEGFNKLLDDMKAGILNQAEFASRRRSRFSSANNHLIVEMSAVFICSVLFGLDGSLEDASYVLETELARQVCEDGVDREQAIHYHGFVVEAYMLCATLLRKNGISYSEAIDATLDRMCQFIRHLMDENGGMPEIGDSDDGKLLEIEPGKFGYYVYLLQACGRLLRKGYVQEFATCPNLRWLFGDEKHVGERFPEKSSAVYECGGYSILRGDTPLGELILTIDHGELGFGEIAAHGHADALALTLRLGGVELISDPGTYVYHTQREWRDYFRKTINHSTVCIDGRDQSEIKGEFMWGKRATASLLAYSLESDKDSVSARCDMPWGDVHTRSVVYKKPGEITIEDVVEGAFEAASAVYVLGIGIKPVKIAENEIDLFFGEQKLAVMTFEGAKSISIERVWVSKGYLEKESSHSLVCVMENKELARLETKLEIC